MWGPYQIDNDDDMVYVKGLTNLEVLELSRTKVTDKGLDHLKGFTKLQRLDLGGTQVTDKGLERLERLTRLETLNLENTTGVSDFGLVHLPRMRRNMVVANRSAM